MKVNARRRTWSTDDKRQLAYSRAYISSLLTIIALSIKGQPIDTYIGIQRAHAFMWAGHGKDSIENREQLK